eukprot:4233626-Alexandrium_andersonii.AAC.1
MHAGLWACEASLEIYADLRSRAGRRQPGGLSPCACLGGCHPRTPHCTLAVTAPLGLPRLARAARVR